MNNKINRMYIHKALALVVIFTLMAMSTPLAFVQGAPAVKTFTASVSPTSVDVNTTTSVTFTITNTSSGGGNPNIKSGRIAIPSGFSITNWSTSQANWDIDLNGNLLEITDGTGSPNPVTPGDSFTVSFDAENTGGVEETSVWNVCMYHNESFNPGGGGQFEAGSGMTAGGCGVNIQIAVVDPNPSPDTGFISINKVAQGVQAPSSWTFGFSGDLGDFDLTDSDTSYSSSTLAMGSYTVTEDSLPNDWTLDQIICDETGSALWSTSSDSVTVTLQDDGDGANCSFFNTYVDPGLPPATTGTLVVEKVIVGSATATSTDFEFAIDGLATTTFATLGYNVFANQATGTYLIQELPVTDFTVTYGGDCDVQGNVEVTAGATSTCTITNTYEGSTPTPVLPAQCISVNLLDNGSFETEKVTDPDSWKLFDYNVDPIAWIVQKVSDASDALLEFHNGWSGNVAAEGDQYVEMDSEESVLISQSAATTIGAQYELFWAFAPRQDTDAANNILGVAVNGVNVATSGPQAGAGVLTNNTWSTSSYAFTASTTSTDISFMDLGTDDSYGTFLDDVVLCMTVEAPTPNDDDDDDNSSPSGGGGGPVLTGSSGGSGTVAGVSTSEEEDEEVDEPVKQVLGAQDQVTIVPVMGVAAGAGGSTPTTQAWYSLLIAKIFGWMY